MRRAFFCLAYLLALSLSLQAANPVPFVSQPLVPASVAPGGAGFTMAVHGTGFVTSSVVRWNGSARATTFVSQSELQAQILATDIASAGTGTVTVTSGGPASNSAFLFIASPISKPKFTRDFLLRANAPNNVVVGDFNNDGKMDLAGASGYASLYRSWPEVGILLGDGNGTFQPVVKYQTVPVTLSLAVGDFNGDGVVDLVVSGVKLSNPTDAAAVSVLIGNGDGTFQPAKNYVQPFTGLCNLLVADFNHDGKLDVEMGCANAPLEVLLGNGDGTFQAPVASLLADGYSTAIGDFNGDGILDLAGAGSISLGNGDGTFQPAINLNTNNIPESGAVADFNGDGKLDLGTTGSDNASLCLGNGDGTFQACNVFPDYQSGNRILLAVDLNGDGKLDLIAEHTGGFISYLLGNGDGTFQNYVAFFFPNPTALVLGDFNGDGRPDFALVGGGGLDSTLGFYQLLQKP